jgi:hypothetical protein
MDGKIHTLYEFAKQRKLSIALMVHTYHSHFISEWVAEASQIFFRDIPILPKLWFGWLGWAAFGKLGTSSLFIIDPTKSKDENLQSVRSTGHDGAET